MAETSVPVPQHIAIIMDGNGRWAQMRGLPRLAGHKQGAETVEDIVRAAGNKGVRYLTLFAFSTENWKRPLEEVNGLMGLLLLYLRSKTAEMHKNNVRLKIIGDRSRLSGDILASIVSAETLTKNNDGLTLQLAISYSGRWDMTQAMQQIAAKVQTGQLQPQEITEAVVAAHLCTANVPDPDLIIRTSGEKRVSNFLLWQSAYAEYYFTDLHWPNFNAATLQTAIDAFQQRERRFGKISVQAS